MSTKQWVCHISGQGEKWEVILENTYQWGTHNTYSTIGHHWLPKSEYRLCEPPEVWRYVTEECDVITEPICQLMHERISRFHTSQWGDNYRLRKIRVCQVGNGDPTDWAFIVEKKVTE